MIELPAKNKKDFKIELITKTIPWKGISLKDIKKEIMSQNHMFELGQTRNFTGKAAMKGNT